jgi:hypothetical protein
VNMRRDAPMEERAALPAAKAMREASGAGAVQQSGRQNAMQMNAQVVATDKDVTNQIIVRNTTQNQFVANRNFINTNGVWVDSDFVETARLPEVKIKFASDEYFRLVTSTPELAPYLSLGEQVVVVWNGRVYRITN